MRLRVVLQQCGLKKLLLLCTPSVTRRICAVTADGTQLPREHSVPMRDTQDTQDTEVTDWTHTGVMGE